MSRELKHWIFNKETGSVVAEVYNDPRFNNGDMISTSKIVDIKDDIITTSSGTLYVLKESYVSSKKDIEEYLKRL